ncbi:MAG: hypothetical protein Q8Q75_09600, partial [Rhodoferax sp.]|uniref:hypothetical protein n=1 Tax=Rhodoferax sp. TaxID=50421 RepID=UPI00273583EC
GWLVATNCGCSRVAAFGQQKDFHCRGSIFQVGGDFFRHLVPDVRRRHDVTELECLRAGAKSHRGQCCLSGQNVQEIDKFHERLLMFSDPWHIASRSMV